MSNTGTRIREIGNRLSLARHLDRVADEIECEERCDDDFINEDAVAVLRWSAAYLRRPMMQEDDLDGALAVFRRILPGFDLLLPRDPMVPLPPGGLRPGSRRCGRS